MNTLETVRAMLAWTLSFNIVALFAWFAMFALAHDWIYTIHTKWFKLSVEQFDALHYGGMALHKMAIFTFLLTPYLALHIVG